MDVGRDAFGQQCAVAQLHRRAGGKHRVDKKQGLVVEAWRGYIFDEDVEIVVVGIFSVGRHECVLGVVENVEESLMERETGAEYGRQNKSVVEQTAARGA